MSDKAMTIHRATDVVQSMDDVARVAQMMAASGYFSDAREAAQAGVKILAGREMGFGPFAAMAGVHIIKGKPAIGSNLMAAAVKAHPRYDYRAEMSDHAVMVTFFDGGEEIGQSAFTTADAQAAGLADKENWKKYPRNMLFSRAISNGVRWFCPDVFAGAPVYTPDELSADDVEAEVVTIEAPAEPADDPAPSPDPVVEAAEDLGATVTETAEATKRERSWSARAVQAVLNAGHAKNAQQATGMLNWSELDRNDPPDVIAEWARVYRTARESGAETAEAAAIANASLPQ